MFTASFYLFLVSVPFGYRVLLHQFTGGFDEYESVFLYVSDVFLLLFLGISFVFNYADRQNNLRRQPSVFYFLLSTFLLFAGLSVFWATIPLLALYSFIRLLLLALMSLAITSLITNYQLLVTKVCGIFAGLAVLESLIGFFQFLLQKSLGLAWLGESVVGQSVRGSAKIIVEGAPVLRAYGTFPHPNVLGAFLVLGLCSLYYFWLRRPSEWKIWSGLTTLKSDLLWGLSIFVVLVGIVLTFSRAAWGVVFLASLLVSGYALLSKKYWIQAIRLIILLLFMAHILVNTFAPFILSRAQISSSEPAVSYRLSYNRLGINLIKENPFGVGIGNQVVHSVKNDIYKDAGLTKPWEWQPVHNIYLLIGAETGILGLLAFILFIVTLLISNLQCSIFNQFSIKKISNILLLSKLWKLNENCKLSLENYIPETMLLSLLILGMFDHFLWTLEPGRLMLWVVIGMVIGSSHFKTIENHD